MAEGTDLQPAFDWPRRIHAVFGRARIRQVGYVPDAGHARLIALCRDDPSVRDVALTTEEEGVALAAGAWLGGNDLARLVSAPGEPNDLVFARIRIAPEELPRVLPERDGVRLEERFRAAIGVGGG